MVELTTREEAERIGRQYRELQLREPISLPIATCRHGCVGLCIHDRARRRVQRGQDFRSPGALAKRACHALVWILQQRRAAFHIYHLAEGIGISHTSARRYIEGFAETGLLERVSYQGGWRVHPEAVGSIT